MIWSACRKARAGFITSLLPKIFNLRLPLPSINNSSELRYSSTFINKTHSTHLPHPSSSETALKMPPKATKVRNRMISSKTRPNLTSLSDPNPNRRQGTSRQGSGREEGGWKEDRSSIRREEEANEDAQGDLQLLHLQRYVFNVAI